MAKINRTGTPSENLTSPSGDTSVNPTQDVVAQDSGVSTSATSPSIADLMAMMQTLTETVNGLKTENAELKEKLAREEATVREGVAVLQPVQDSTSTSLDRLAEVLGSRKSDKEVVIVHNMQLTGGLATSIKLTGATIDFHTLGEERVLSWQQFEECVSKYRKWFDKQIILLGPGNEELAERYNVPCVKRQGKAVVTMNDLQTIHRKSERELEDYMDTLTEQDQDHVCAYWLGMCYQKDERYMVRSKIELLNRITGKGYFNNILVDMNFGSIT